MIYILDRYGSVQRVITNKSPKAMTFWNDSHVEALTGELSYDFESPADIDAAEFLVEENMVLWADLDGTKRLARIKTAREQVDSDGRYVKLIHAEGTHGDLNGYLIDGDITFEGETLKDIIAALLSGTDWAVGSIEFDDVFEMTFQIGTTKLAAIRNAIAASGLEWRYRIEWDGNRVTGRFVDGVKRIGRYTGEQFTLGRNIRGFSRLRDSSDMATAALPLGGTGETGLRTTIAEAEWSVESGDPVDKPLGSVIVGDPQALALYGHGHHITRPFEDSEETSPTKLLAKAWAWLQSGVNRPRVTYEMNAAMLDSLPGNAGRRLNLGDSITAIVPRFRPPVEAEARVAEIRRSYSDSTGSGYSTSRAVD